MGKLDGKVALVTGAGSGIGQATALLFAQEGAKVVVADADARRGQETVSRVRAAKGQAVFVLADVSKERDVQRMLQVALRRYGRLDILMNNAGILTPIPVKEELGDSAWAAVPLVGWRRTVDINLVGVILGSQYAVPIMRRQGGGAIINTASGAGLVGHRTDPVYGATKGGVILFTKSLAPLAREWNIRVNCLCPAMVNTRIHETAGGVAALRKSRAQRMLTPDVVAQAALRLALSRRAGAAVSVILPATGQTQRR